MYRNQFVKATGAVAALLAITLAATLGRSGRVRAEDGDGEESKIQQGYAIAPVPLNLEGKDRALVGLGSYIVNAHADCNGCHLAPVGPAYVPGGDPYEGQKPTKVSPNGYLGGGIPFDVLLPTGIPSGAVVFSRNLTPDKTGRPEGGHTFEEFRQIIRTGGDMDHLHPILPAPLDGAVLQVMPWPVFQNMTDHDLRAVYEYLSAIPCFAGPPSGPLHNDCN